MTSTESTTTSLTHEYHVTEHEIMNGTPNESATCPIALSIWQSGDFQGDVIKDVEVSATYVRIITGLNNDSKHYEAVLDKEAQLWISAFDTDAKLIYGDDDSYDEDELERKTRLSLFSPITVTLLFEQTDIPEDSYYRW